MRSTFVLSLLALLQPALSLFLLVPLYVYPGDGLTEWQPLFKAIAKYPTVQFQVIINYNSGPGTVAPPTDTNYIDGVAQLNSYKNTKLVGYVDTKYTKKSVADVTKEVNLYAAWKSYKAKNIALSGIFFDDGVNDNSAASHNYLANVSSKAYAAFPKPGGKVVYNPGSTLDAIYFNYVDTIIEYEGSLANFNGPSTIATFQQSKLSQDSVILYNAQPTAARVKTLIGNLSNKKVGSVFATSDCCYNAVNGTLVELLAAQIKATS